MQHCQTRFHVSDRISLSWGNKWYVKVLKFHQATSMFLQSRHDNSRRDHFLSRFHFPKEMVHYPTGGLCIKKVKCAIDDNYIRPSALCKNMCMHHLLGQYKTTLQVNINSDTSWFFLFWGNFWGYLFNSSREKVTIGGWWGHAVNEVNEPVTMTKSKKTAK